MRGIWQSFYLATKKNGHFGHGANVHAQISMCTCSSSDNQGKNGKNYEGPEHAVINWPEHLET